MAIDHARAQPIATTVDLRSSSPPPTVHPDAPADAPPAMHAPSMHRASVVQSASLAQLVLHAAGSHAYGAHVVVVALHAPAPSHVPRIVCTPSLHPSNPHADPTREG
jgi:hypothetical protein